MVQNNCNCGPQSLNDWSNLLAAWQLEATVAGRALDADYWKYLDKTSPMYNGGYSRAINTLSNIETLINTVDYGSKVVNQEVGIFSPETALYTGDMIMSRIGTKTPFGFAMNLSWNAGKWAAMKKNEWERRELMKLLSIPD